MRKECEAIDGVHPARLNRGEQCDWTTLFQKSRTSSSFPDLLAIQRDSFGWFRDEGRGEAFRDVSPIEDFTGNLP